MSEPADHKMTRREVVRLLGAVGERRARLISSLKSYRDVKCRNQGTFGLAHGVSMPLWTAQSRHGLSHPTLLGKNRDIIASYVTYSNIDAAPVSRARYDARR